MILVTGAAGKTGQAILHALADRHAGWRALVRRPAAAEAQPPADCQFVVGDLLNSEDVKRAVEGSSAVYHIPPNMHPDEERMAQSLLQAAAKQGVTHFVYHSVLHPQSTAMPHHARKLRVEEAVLASRLPFTLLQPAAYMQNLLPYVDQARQHGSLRLPYPPATRLNLVDLADIAQAAAIVLTMPGHTGATYELAGPDNPNQHQVAALLADLLGRPVAASQQRLEKWRQAAASRGLDAGRIDDFLAMFGYYADHDFTGNDRVLTHLLGRKPKNLRTFLADALRAGRD